MLFIPVMLILFLLSYVKNNVYLYYTEDSSSVEFFDCIYYENFLYCRRPFQPISLQRNNQSKECYNNGTFHSFSSLLLNNINVNTILHKWKSSIEKAEEYSRYIRQDIKSIDPNKKYLCECKNRQSFGKYCEYLFPFGTTFEMTLHWENSMKSIYQEQNQYHSDILCYKTLNCNSGLLCLDWRDICDGIQQCQFGYDEENCDKLEFNECEYNEYRCMNGMCIPDEYFLDGDYDCMDLSDEIQIFNDTLCTFQGVTLECDDRICSPNEWSCGDGQCIQNRIYFHIRDSTEIECNSRRDQYHMCESHAVNRQWTLPNGKCYFINKYEEFNNQNLSEHDRCIYLAKCVLSSGVEKNCPCKYNPVCMDDEDTEIPCSYDNIQYPDGAIVAPYIYFIYSNTHESWDKTPKNIQINGTIKCQGYLINRYMTIPYDSKINLQEMESIFCNSQINSNFNCYNNSRTFNNNSYNYINICKQSKECISAYRINDGYINCADRMDEQQNNSIVTSCSTRLQHHRFRCSIDQPTCLIIKNLGNLKPNCHNNYDEWWMGSNIMLSNMKCNKKSKDDCQLIRQYIEMSWKDDIFDFEFSTTKISFRTYCDTFWNFGSKQDEDINMCSKWWICPDDQWQCYSGQCINVTWVLDGEWDCMDASDEESLFFYNHSLLIRNLKLLSMSLLEDKFEDLYGKSAQAFSNICDIKEEFPCFRVNVVNPLSNITLKRPCIDLHQLGDGHIDCIGGIDERNTIQHCNYPAMLGNDFLCISSNTCIDKLDLCKKSCINEADDHVLCSTNNLPVADCSLLVYIICINSQCVRRDLCDKKHDCSYGEDEYMCDRSKNSRQQPTKILYRRIKENIIKNTYQTIQLPRFPNNSNFVNLSLIQNRTEISIIESNLTSSHNISYSCNRGVGVFLYNESIICFCPPQYYGDRCQFYNDRLTVILHLNLSQSIYTELTKYTILLKLLVLFLFENQTLDIQEFHVRPAFEIMVYKKKISYFIYSRSHQLLESKRKRFFNRTNIINEHSYSIRIELYQLNINVKPRIIAVWKYPIYFDYLPSFRLSKILQLIKLDDIQNPCSSKPCPSYQECYPLLNQISDYACLCDNNSTGDNCSDIDKMCIEGYCSSNALCKPNYRNILNGNEMPYCICPLNQYGRRCQLLHDICYSNPCQNNGICLPASRPNEFSCRCTSEFYGDLCQLQNQAVVLYINESVNHEGAVVQYFHIDLFSLDLILVHQRVLRSLPNVLFHLHGTDAAPDIIVAKLYSNGEVKIYLISIQMNVTSINETTYINEKNYCENVRSLFEFNEEISPFKYHYLCIKNENLLCFIDDLYLCICNENNSRVECFSYDHNLDQCSSCLSSGKCLKGDRSRTIDFICLCPKCHRGSLCQFNTEIQSFSLDSLLIESHFNVRILYLTIVILIFIVGAINNYASFITFKRSNPFRIGVGKCLLLFSLISQFSLLVLLIKTIQNIFDFFTNNISCKVISFLLSVSTRYSFWLTSWVTLYRLCLLIFPFNDFLKKSSMTYIISFITLIIVAGMHTHELFFYIIIQERDGQIMCVANFTDVMSIYNRITVLTHYMIPFCIQIVSITILIVLAARTRSRATSKDGHRFIRLLKQQFNTHKEHYVTPLIIILSSFPQIVLAFSFACNAPVTWQRHALLIVYFLSYAPQLLGFILCVLPSTGYSKEFRETSLSKTFLFKWMLSQENHVKRIATSPHQNIAGLNVSM